jgi:mannose-6-phosphate isomerase-like protein (cupin superfamily)
MAGRFAANLDSLLAAHPYTDTTRVQADRITSVEGASLNLVQTRVRVLPHFHARHDETVVVLRGRGLYDSGSVDRKELRTTRIGPGTVLQIPRGTVHTVRVEGTEPLVAYSIFSPPLDPTDRHPVPGWPGRRPAR